MKATHNDARKQPATRHRYLVATIAVLLIYLIIEVVAFVGLRVIEATGRAGYLPTRTDSVSLQHRVILEQLIAGRTGYLSHDSVLGWANRPGGSDALYTANSQGMRSDHDYTPAPVPGKLRMAAFGDSFMHADDVLNEEAWSAIVEAREPGIEVLNFGVGGYGPDQAYLRYLEEGRRFAPDIVLIGMMSENINRVVSVYRPFYAPATGNPLAKPYFRLVDERLVREPNPMPTLASYAALLEMPAEILPALGEHDFHYGFRYRKGPLDFSPLVRLTKLIVFELKTRVANPFLEAGQYRTNSSQYRLLDRVLREFRCAALGEGSLPITVLFPHRADIAAAIDGEPLTYRPLADALRVEGLQVIDLADAFATPAPDTALDDLVLAHYTPRGNELIAAFIIEQIRMASLEEGAVRRQLIAQQRKQCGPGDPDVAGE